MFVMCRQAHVLHVYLVQIFLLRVHFSHATSHASRRNAWLESADGYGGGVPWMRWDGMEAEGARTIMEAVVRQTASLPSSRRKSRGVEASD